MKCTQSSQHKGKDLESTLKHFYNTDPDYKHIRKQTPEHWLCLETSFRKINPLKAKTPWIPSPFDCPTEFTDHFPTSAGIPVQSAKNHAQS